jgi:predicted ferric reductase
MSLAIRGVFWVGVYIAVVAGPPVFALFDAPEGRDFWAEFSVALGFIGLSMMGMQFVLVARFRSVAAPFGEDAVVQFHRQMSYVATAFVLYATPIRHPGGGPDLAAPCRRRGALRHRAMMPAPQAFRATPAQ